MIRHPRRWLRTVLPVDQLAYLLLAVLLSMIAIRSIRDRGSLDKLVIWQYFLVYGSTILYGAFRSIYFHPIENRRYGNWLVDSPWHYPQPLPLGPLHLVWQDVLLVLVWSLLLPTETMSPLSVPILFLLVYCFGLSYNFCRMRVYQPLFIIGLLVGGFILALPDEIWCTAVALAIYGVAYWGIQLLLAHLSNGKEIPLHVGWGLPTEQVEPLLGWPAPPEPTERYRWSLSQTDAFQFAVVVGWLFFCVAWQSRDAIQLEQGLQNALGLIAAVAIGGRILTYVVGYMPPISLLGRAFTGRWIIPGYDIVFAAPLAALLATMVLPDAAVAVGL
jgi:hypothetical protein